MSGFLIEIILLVKEIVNEPSIWESFSSDVEGCVTFYYLHHCLGGRKAKNISILG